MLDPMLLTDNIEKVLRGATFTQSRGRIVSATGRVIKAPLKEVSIGELCLLQNAGQSETSFAEVIGFQNEFALLSPLGELEGMSTKTEILPTGDSLKVRISDEILGKVLDGMGQPLNGPFEWNLKVHERTTEASPPNPLTRKPIETAVSTGIKAIDSLITVGEGQRLGIFAPAGVGKSTLLSELTKGTDCDVVVCALIGERGREVNEFIEQGLSTAGLENSCIVVATSDRPPLERIKAAHVAMTIAEHFRDQGKRVMFLMDSVTRYARALREIGIQVGEPPARRGYPPSVFAALPRLVERAGNNAVGSITSFLTILCEGDDESDPIAEEMRSLLDGHITLSRKLANSGHYPAIDALKSVSRIMNHITHPSHLKAAQKMRELMAKFKDIELLVNMGEYKKGSDPVADEAIRKISMINEFLRQGIDDHQSLDQTVSELQRLMGS